ncbi:MAG: hypothetical protein ACRC54_05120 [Fusobacteriaceae bacterium]
MNEWGKSNEGITSKQWFVVIMLLFFTPVGIYFMWRNNSFSKVARIIITAIMGLFFVGIMAVSSGTSNDEKGQKVIESNKIEEVKEEKIDKVQDEKDKIEQVKKEIKKVTLDYEARHLDLWMEMANNMKKSDLQKTYEYASKSLERVKKIYLDTLMINFEKTGNVEFDNRVEAYKDKLSTAYYLKKDSLEKLLLALEDTSSIKRANEVKEAMEKASNYWTTFQFSTAIMTITDDDIKSYNEQKEKETAVNEVENKEKEIVKEKVVKEIVKPKKLMYKEDDVYTHLIWKGYSGERSLERFKEANGMPANKAINEKVLKALGMEIKYKQEIQKKVKKTEVKKIETENNASKEQENAIESSMEKPEYVLDVKKTSDGDYKATSQFQSSFSDDGTLGVSFTRICYTLKYLQVTYPNAKWYFVQLVDDDGEMVMEGNFKNKNANLKDKKDSLTMGRELLSKGTLNARSNGNWKKIKGFLDDGYIPVM